MSENLELVRSIFAALEQGDWSSTELFKPEIEWTFPDGPTPASGTGVTEMRRFHRDFLGAWENLRAEAEEFRELDAERVLVLGRMSGRGRSSGLPTVAKTASLYHLRDGKVAKLRFYWDRDRAFADLGLEDG